MKTSILGERTLKGALEEGVAINRICIWRLDIDGIYGNMKEIDRICRMKNVNQMCIGISLTRNGREGIEMEPIPSCWCFECLVYHNNNDWQFLTGAQYFRILDESTPWLCFA